ncbi:MAG: hypothetical protein E7551_07925 [Ruminococcaceae bacterium]|nr:hypothetical protein [Oscillospiraceae bacterium]
MNNNLNNESTNNENVVFVPDILENFKPRDKEAFRIIVSSGVSEEKDAKELIIDRFIEEKDKSISSHTAYLHIKTLCDMGLLKKKRMSTGYRPFNILLITPLGQHTYRKLFRKEPPVQEHYKLLKEHSSIPHAYMIKDVKTVLEKTGNFSRITMGRKENRIPLYDAKSVIPDIIAYINNKPAYFIEVECGNHNQEQFNEKLNKLVGITKTVIIVGRNREDVTNLLKPQVDKYIKFKHLDVLRFSETHIYLFSINDLSRGKFTYHYDMNSKEPICGFGRKSKEV